MDQPGLIKSSKRFTALNEFKELEKCTSLLSVSGFHGWRISKYDYCSNTFVKSSSQKPAKIEDEWNFNIGNGLFTLDVNRPLYSMGSSVGWQRFCCHFLFYWHYQIGIRLKLGLGFVSHQG